MASAMVLSAGLGTRLRPLTDELPKPLMPVGDRPAIEHVLERLAAAGVDRVVINTHHHPEAFEDWFLGLRAPRVAALSDAAGAPHAAPGADPLPGDLRVVYEPEILGTAGGVASAKAALGEGDVIVVNGDALAPDLDVARLEEAHRRSGAPITWVIGPRPRGQGTVGVDSFGRLVRVRGRVFGEEASGGDYLCAQWISAAVRPRLPSPGCLVADFAIPLLESGAAIGTFAYEGEWFDIGSPEMLLAANLAWLARRGLDSFLGPGAEIGPRVRLERAVVSGGARLEGEGVLRDALILAGARATAPSSRVIVGRRSTVTLSLRT